MSVPLVIWSASSARGKVSVAIAEVTTMQNASRDREASELSYQGPLIGMRSTRPKTTSADGGKKSVELEKPTLRQ